MSHRFSVRRLRVPVLALSLTAAVAAPAARGQEDLDVAADSAATPPPKLRTIEEVIVTAQKREQAEIDVPISISVVDAEFIAREGISDLRDISLYVPNVRIETHSTSPDVRVRGFASSAGNKAFEQPVGIVIDGIPYNRLEVIQGALFDVQRVEVLRGPQGTLFGKNTTAGVIHTITQDPTEDYTGSIDLQIGDFGRRRVEAAVGGPIVSDVVSFRIAGLSEDRDGYMRNTTAALSTAAVAEPLGRDRLALRGKLDFPNLFGSRLKLAYETYEQQFDGAGTELSFVPETQAKQYIIDWDPNVDFRLDWRSSIDEFQGSKSTVHAFVATGSTELGGWGLDAVGGYFTSDLFGKIDGDFTPMPAGFFTSEDEGRQATIEIRATAPTFPGLFGLGGIGGFGLGSTDFIGGVFYQRREILDSAARFVFDDSVLGEFIFFQSFPPGSFPPDPTRRERETQDDIEDSTLFFEQEHDSWAGFGQFDWYFLPQWTLTYGTRIQYETKEAAWERIFDTPGNPILTAVGFEEFTAKRDLDETQLLHKASLNYQPWEGLSLFASWARGFKGGGFNEFTSNGDELDFDPEKTTEWALHAKSRLLGGTARLNSSLYWMELEDFQVLTLRPLAVSGQFVVDNAARARARGLEADLLWLPTEWSTIVTGFGFNDTEFLEFPIAPCPGNDPNADGDEEPRCDVAGEPFERSPKWSVALIGNVALPLSVFPGLGRLSLAGSETLLTTGLGLEYQDTQFLYPDFDAEKRQESFLRLRASLGAMNLGQGWSVQVVGENLTNELTSLLSFEVTGGPGHIWRIPESRRSIHGHLRYQF